MEAVKMGFSVVRSAVRLKSEDHRDPPRSGSAYEKVARWSRRDNKTPIAAVSARPRMSWRANCAVTRGPKKLFWLTVNLLPRLTGGRPGRATVPTGRLPFRGF